MENFLFFIFACFGLTEIVMIGRPTAPLRWLLTKIVGRGYVRCALCIGFASGVLLGFVCFNDGLARGDSLVRVITRQFVCGFVGAGASYFLHGMVNPLGGMFKEGEGESTTPPHRGEASIR